MKVKVYRAYNADNQLLKEFIANDIKTASDKIKFWYGKNACFIKLKYMYNTTMEERKKLRV